jgi:hypothetical protein
VYAHGEPGESSPTSHPSPPKPTGHPCPRCGAKLVRLPETPVVDGWVNLDCKTPGCTGVKAVKVESLEVAQ